MGHLGRKTPASAESQGEMARTYLIPVEDGWALRHGEDIAVASLSWDKALRLATELGGQLVVETTDPNSALSDEA